ncbi:YhbY family RNA-binding protein [Candidatus Thorarchaeota archaeon]|nr:MAG: YhbY family RNA-binding protein [Candidatus Thorarchaeota archaeon]
MRPEGDQNRIKRAWQEPAMVQIGKGGVSEDFVKETIRLLKKHNYIKVRMLRSALGTTSKLELMNDLCEKTGATLAGVRGNTAVIHRIRASQRA